MITRAARSLRFPFALVALSLAPLGCGDAAVPLAPVPDASGLDASGVDAATLDAHPADAPRVTDPADSGPSAPGDLGRDASADTRDVPTVRDAPAVDAGSGHAIRTVFVVLMENHNWSEIRGSASAPYINGTLLPMGAHAEAYTNPPRLHPSEPNYLWLEGGSNFGVLNDNPPSANHQATPDHLVTQLRRTRLIWTGDSPEGWDGRRAHDDERDEEGRGRGAARAGAAMEPESQARGGAAAAQG